LNLKSLAVDYLRRAEMRVKSARLALDSSSYPDVVRFGQEAVELSLKASLRAFGVEYPKEHDVGEVLQREEDRFPPWFKALSEHLAEVSADLAAKRAAAMYGLEAGGKPPGELFQEEDAKRALTDAEEVLAAARRLVLGQGVVEGR
jgi:HEPN domain-containing protein